MSKKDKPTFLEEDEVVFDEAEDFVIIEENTVAEEVFNGLSDEDLSAKTGPFSFTCTRRERCVTKDGFNYFVTPDAEYTDLDFEGHMVLINDRPRMCSSFDVDEDGHIVIFVSGLSETHSASKEG